MPRVLWLGALLVVRLWAQAPAYSSSSIVNAATNRPGPLAPLGLVSVYGSNLAIGTRGISIDELRNGLLPTTLNGSGALVSVDNIGIPVLFASPGQLNVLIPGSIRPGRRKLRVAMNGRTGPEVEIDIADTSPGLFQTAGSVAIATRPNGSLLTLDDPAVAGDVVILYAAGLGNTSPAVNGLSIPLNAAPIALRRQFAVLLNGEPIPDENIFYAGVTPGFAGLYQVNFRLPESTASNPEIRLRLPNQTSPPSLTLPVRPAPAPVQ
ncbi:MAG: hypothetical protein FJW30_04330 [Acidobacteria bacterium]|nr:hypothetical protein [Acidobacteriota bacterium]